MPRESVYSSTPHSTPEGLLDGEIDFAAPFTLQVGWHRDLHASVGITLPDNQTLLTRFYGHEDQLATLGMQMEEFIHENGGEVIDWVSSDAERSGRIEMGRKVIEMVEATRVHTPENDGLWVSIDRPMANKLIELVRKARNYAFGKDA